jgi:hypothetical protein
MSANSNDGPGRPERRLEAVVLRCAWPAPAGRQGEPCRVREGPGQSLVAAIGCNMD